MQYAQSRFGVEARLLRVFQDKYRMNIEQTKVCSHSKIIRFQS